jgi:hypothetical protein
MSPQSGVFSCFYVTFLALRLQDFIAFFDVHFN